jgi:hypothetical protein
MTSSLMDTLSYVTSALSSESTDHKSQSPSDVCVSVSVPCLSAEMLHNSDAFPAVALKYFLDDGTPLFPMASETKNRRKPRSDVTSKQSSDTFTNCGSIRKNMQKRLQYSSSCSSSTSDIPKNNSEDISQGWLTI